MPSIQELVPFISEPREDLSVEYKRWIDVTDNANKAKLAKAAIALANHGGGYIVIGFHDEGQELQPLERPNNVPEVTQDAINSAIRRHASPEFHCEMYNIPHPVTGTIYPVIAVPGNIAVPIMCCRGYDGIIVKNSCYIRKPGPRSEDPHTGDEWRTLLNRCIRAGKEDMLEAIRAIVSGRIEIENPTPGIAEQLQDYCDNSHARWSELSDPLPSLSSSRFPYGYYEMGFSIVGGSPVESLSQLKDKMDQARRISLTGWPPFISVGTPEWAPYPHENFIEAWLGKPRNGASDSDPSVCDYWRASMEGKLYTIRGYAEDRVASDNPGTRFDVVLPIWRIAEGLLFAHRFSETFDDIDEIALQCRFTGLENRSLTSITGRRIFFSGRVSQTNAITLKTQATPVQVENNLAEIIHPLLSPLYELFGFFELPFTMVEEELESMRQGRF